MYSFRKPLGIDFLPDANRNFVQEILLHGSCRGERIIVEEVRALVSVPSCYWKDPLFSKSIDVLDDSARFADRS